MKNKRSVPHTGTLKTGDKIKALSYYFRNHASGYSIARAMMPVVNETAAGGRAVDIIELPCAGTNPRTVLKNLWYTLRSRPSDRICHITGEVHYLSYLLPREQTVITVHDLAGLFGYRGIDLSYYRWRCVDSLYRARFVAAVSEKTRQVILENSKLDPDKVSVIHDPLPPGFKFTPRKFNSDRPIILQVGATPWKNPARVAQALEGLNVHYRLIGMPDEDCIRILERNKTEYSIVTGLDDAALICEYENADIVAFASFSEGFGMPLIEAQAVGRPALVSNIAPQPEVGGRGGALYVDPADTEAMHKGFARLINSAQLRADITGCGLENVKRFAPERIAAQYEELYSAMD